MIDGYTIEPGLVDASQADADTQPDWQRLFPVPTCHPRRPDLADSRACRAHGEEATCYSCSWAECSECAGTDLTPRLAFFLHLRATILADQLADDLASDIVDPGIGTLDLGAALMWEGVLPPTVERDATRAWAERFVACFETIAGRLAAGRVPYPNCTGEEMALHTILDHAESLAADGEVAAAFHDWYGHLPASADDEDFAWLREVLFEDHDVLLLFDPALDGIEDPDNPVHQQLGMANLEARSWFLPFRAPAAAA